MIESLVTLTAAALADSVNPCGIAALIILLMTLVADKKSHKVIVSGFAFIGGLFLVYFLFGLGVFQFLKISFIAKPLHYIIGLFAVYVGGHSIYNYWKKRNECRVCENDTTIKVPSWGGRFFRIISKDITSLPGSFLLGVFVSFIEIPCTGGPYFFALGYLAERTKLALIPYLLFYNIITFLPLIILVFLIYFRVSNVEQAKKWKEKNLLKLQLIVGIVMIILGVYIIFA